MFSDLTCNTFLAGGLPSPLEAHPDDEPLAPLYFDDLLDIANEFEFTSTITHIWPCEEPSTPETGLDDMFAAVVSTPNEESSLPSIPPDPAQEVDFHKLVSMRPSPCANAKDALPLPPDDDRVQAEVENPITSMLWGWSPPDGSQFLDLDDSLVFPQSVKDITISPWLATFLPPSYTEPARNISELSAATSDLPPASAPDPMAPLVSTIDMAVDGPRRKTVPFMRAVLEPIRAGSSPQVNANIPGQTVRTPRVKTLKSHAHLPSTLATGGPSPAKHAKAPRGGIPPHIARTVTKANILRIEKERKVIQNAFPGTSMGEGNKPSVLRRTVKAEDGCGGNGKKPFDRTRSDTNEKEGRAAKRARA